MNNYYQNQLAHAGAQQRRQQAGQPDNIMIPNTNPGVHNSQSSPHHTQPMMGGMPQDTHMMGGEFLDDIISQNAETRRRQSVPQPFSPHQASHDDTDRRMSMMEFGSNNDNFRGFQFGTSLPTTVPSSVADVMPAYGNMSSINSPIAMPPHSSTFNQTLSMSDPTDFSTMSPDVMNNMMSFSNLSMGQMSSDPNAMGLYANPNLSPHFGNSGMDPVSPDFSMDMNADDSISGATTQPPSSLGMHSGGGDMINVTGQFGNNASGTTQQPQHGSGAAMPTFSMTPGLSREMSSATSYHQSPVSPVSQSLSTPRPSVAPDTPMSGPAAASTVATPVDVKTEPKNIYSKTGFDMIRALYYVATRPNPEIQLGAVDLSCAFVVCDITLNDCPIIYVSDNFQNLTGYSRHDILGQNCRFLQAPDGKVEAGTKREFVANDAVFNLKRKVQEGKECQQSLINYRKGGKPFLNLLTMIPIPWETKNIRYFIGFQIDLVECPDAISGQEMGKMEVNYKHSDIGQYIWNPPSSQVDQDAGQTLTPDDVSTLLQQLKPGGTAMGDWHKQSWDKMLLENADDVVHVLSLKGLFLYLSPSCKKILEYDTKELVGNQLSSICHPSDIVPVTRELKDAAVGNHVNIVFRIRRKESGYTWFESHGSLFAEQGKGRKCIILVGRKRPVFALSRRDIERNGGIGDGELWSKLSTSGMYLFVSSNCRSLLDLHPENLVGTSIQDQMRKETRPEFGRSIEKARRGKIVACKHEIQNKRGQILQAQTILYPGDASEGQKPTFLLAQTKLLKASSRALAPASSAGRPASVLSAGPPEDPTQPSHGSLASPIRARSISGPEQGGISAAQGGSLSLGSQDAALASDDNIFDELKTTRCSSWQYELRQMEKVNRLLAEELGQLLSNKKKRKRRKGVGNVVRDCANCHTRNTPEWRRGPSGQRDLCNSCGLRWAKQTGRVSPRTSSRGGNGDTYSKQSNSPRHSSPLHREVAGSMRASGGSQSRSQGMSNSIGDSGKTNQSSSSTNAANNATATASNVSSGGGATTPLKGAFPPPSQPLLEGGSGADGHSMGMDSIAEERDVTEQL
ncbi:White collar 1 protein [Cytospora mali]|uniref:White collar 1 protein n=1 Tax=Cytospora mali TaxID=578113 RepID=A0A194V6K1_CYTMA|nr:White collar 1 protein [Valsa mali var. pyri (nom. inval.)]